jgi:hypothetical protein
MNVLTTGKGSHETSHLEDGPLGPAKQTDSASAEPTSVKSRDLSSHFCRACGDALAPGSRNVFHSQCLRADKRRRTREERQRERERFGKWLSRQVCPRCGAQLGTVARRPRPTARPPREASQGAVERSPDDEKAVNAGRRLGARIGQNDREMEGGK